MTLPKGYVQPHHQNFLAQKSNYRLILEPSLITKPSWELDKIRASDAEGFKHVYWILINPVELGSEIEFFIPTKKDPVSVYKIPIQDIHDVSFIKSGKGLFASRNNSIKISYYKEGRTNEVILNCRGNKEHEVVKLIQGLRDVNSSDY